MIPENTFQIFVIAAKETLTLEVGKKDTILDLKREVEKRIGASVSDRRLTYAGKELKNEGTIEDYAINQEATLILLGRARGGGDYQIFVTLIGGNNITLTINSETNVRTIKEQVSKEVNRNYDDIRLIYRGKQLKDGLTVRDYDIHKGSTLFLTYRLLGGCVFSLFRISLH